MPSPQSQQPHTYTVAPIEGGCLHTVTHTISVAHTRAHTHTQEVVTTTVHRQTHIHLNMHVYTEVTEMALLSSLRVSHTHTICHRHTPLTHEEDGYLQPLMQSQVNIYRPAPVRKRHTNSHSRQTDR